MRPHAALPKNTTPTRPRDFARLILAARNEVTGQALLSRVPVAWLQLVQTHIACAEQRFEQQRRQRESRRPNAHPTPPVLAIYHAPQRRPNNRYLAHQHLAGLRAALNPSGAFQ